MAAAIRPSCSGQASNRWRRRPSLHHAPGRGREPAVRFLDGYRVRFLQCDGYVAYDAPAALARPEGAWQLVHCWTHVRRRFVKRLENDGSPIAELYAMIRQHSKWLAAQPVITASGVTRHFP